MSNCDDDGRKPTGLALFENVGCVFERCSQRLQLANTVAGRVKRT